MTNHANAPVGQGNADVDGRATGTGWASRAEVRERWQSREGMASSLLAVGLTIVNLIVGLACLFIGGMSSDGCHGETPCHSADAGQWAATIAVVMLGISLAVAYVGMFVYVRTNRSLVAPPLLGLAITAATVIVFFAVVSS